MSPETRCRFRSSLGGASYCEEPPCEDGFCRFHYECLLAGEILPNGQINEALSDQNRRRRINFHGLVRDTRPYLDDESL